MPGARQLTPLQHEPADVHEVLSQTHVLGPTGPPPGPPPADMPFEQCWPDTHCGLTPQRHMPFEQVSARFGGQVLQPWPFTPHSDSVVPETQRGGATFLLQQPTQLAGSHWQDPPMHLLPGGHGAPSFLQTQLPDASQLSVRSVLHAVHLPPLPQLGQACETHEVPLQHWFAGQVAGQVPPVHCWLTQVPGVQSAQLWPPLPHCVSTMPPWHCDGDLLSQQPWQLEGSQTHWPDTHVSPTGHVTPLHVQVPFVQVGSDGGHCMHVPWLPHWLLEPPGTQRDGVAVEQQPAHEVGSQTH